MQPSLPSGALDGPTSYERLQVEGPDPDAAKFRKAQSGRGRVVSLLAFFGSEAFEMSALRVTVALMPGVSVSREVLQSGPRPP